MKHAYGYVARRFVQFSCALESFLRDCVSRREELRGFFIMTGILGDM